MARGIFILLLIIVVTLFIFEMCDRNIGAQETNDFSQVLANQKVILEKLESIDNKLAQLKMRIRQ